MVYHDIDIPLPAFIAIDWTGMTLALIPILVRFSLRRRELLPPQLTTKISDGLVLLSWLAGLVLISINTWKNSLRQQYIHWPKNQIYYGVPRDQAAHLLYVSWISLYFIYISLWAAKFALLAFYASLLSLQGRGARVMLWSATAFTTGTFVLHMVLLTRWCSPVSSNWNINGHLCSAVHDITSVTISTVANVATDLVILAIPLVALLMMRHQRLSLGAIGKAETSGLAFVLLMGAMSITAAITRWVTLKLVQKVPKANITHTIDVWALVEIVTSLLAVCLPSLRTFVRRSRSKRGSRDSAVSKDMQSSERSSSAVHVVSVDMSILEQGKARRGSIGSAESIEEPGLRPNRGFLHPGERPDAGTSSERLLEGPGK